MSINSKDKGSRFERQLASMFRDYGYKEARRTAQYCGNTGQAADIEGVPGLQNFKTLSKFASGLPGPPTN